MGPADRVRLHRKDQILMHSGILPPYSLGIDIFALERPHAMHLPHHPSARCELAQIDQGGGPFLAAAVFVQAPSPEMMRACHHSGLDTFGDPNLIDEVAYFSMHFEQVVAPYTETVCIFGMQPQWIAMRNFIEPLGVARARMNQRRQAKGRHQQHLAPARIDMIAMNMAADVGWNRILRPFPILERFREELEFARGRGKSAARCSINAHPNRGTIGY